VDPYHLRHFCGSHLADLGCTAQDIAEQLGHTDGGALA
jgi:integrase